MLKQPQFSVYQHQIILATNERLTRKFIVLKDEYGCLQFTDFHQYIKSASNINKLTSNGNNRFDFVVMFLNYVFFHVGILSLNDITVDVIADFLNKYGLCQLPGDTVTTTRSKDTVIRCFNVITAFIESYLEKNEKRCTLKKTDLYHTVNKRDKHGKVIKVKKPVFEISYKDSVRAPLYRDIPNKCFFILLSHIAVHHKNLLGLVMCSAFGGLRPSEACNVRRPDSPLGPGIRFSSVGSKVYNIEIDLQKELKLRDDDVIVGNIKKERRQVIPDIFVDSFMACYELYMSYMDTRPIDTKYGAFTLNKQGRAMTYASYLSKFHAIVEEELIPIFLADSDPEVIRYGRILMEHKLSPHVFRHWFTVQLVLSGVSEPGVLMHLRGDKTPESSLRYLADKGELAKKYAKVTNNTFDFIKWSSNYLKND